MMRQTFIVKQFVDSYDLVVTGLMTSFSIHPLSTLNKQSYEMMIDCLKGLRNGLSGFYQFPKYTTMPELQVTLQKHDVDSIVLQISLGAITLCDFDDEDFEELITELEALPFLPIGSKVYFV